MLRFCFAVCVLCHATPARSVDSDWNQWRGAAQRGFADQSLAGDELSIKWEANVPGRGGSTPVIAGGQIFLTSGFDDANHLMAFDAATGQSRWKVAIGTDRGKKHRKGGGSNPSPVTDGKTVVAYFRSGDLAGVSTDGELKWKINLQEEYGEDTLWWDLGSSPTLAGDLVIVPVMQTGPSYVVAYDVTTGEQRWKVERQTEAPEEAAQSYATAVVVQCDDGPQLAVMGADTLTLHDLQTGRERARLGGFNPDGEKYFRSIASPVADGHRILCPYSRGETLTCVDANRLLAGDGPDAILWHRDGLGSDVPTPAARDGVAYVLSDGKGKEAAVIAIDLESGMETQRVPLPRTRAGYSSSPLVVGSDVVTLSEHGELTVVGPIDNESEVRGTLDLPDDEPFTVASPVPMEDGLLLRTHGMLYFVR